MCVLDNRYGVCMCACVNACICMNVYECESVCKFVYLCVKQAISCLGVMQFPNAIKHKTHAMVCAQNVCACMLVYLCVCDNANV